jgi:hypothetical protein
LNIIKKTAFYFAGKKFCREAIDQKADLTTIREKPSQAVLIGVIMIAFSYVIGLPAVAVMGVIAAWMKEPLVFIVGGPLIYAISTLVFIIGIKLAGKKYFLTFLRWMVRVILEKILGEDICKETGNGPGRASL